MISGWRLLIGMGDMHRVEKGREIYREKETERQSDREGRINYAML